MGALCRWKGGLEESAEDMERAAVLVCNGRTHTSAYVPPLYSSTEMLRRTSFAVLGIARSSRRNEPLYIWRELGSAP